MATKLYLLTKSTHYPSMRITIRNRILVVFLGVALIQGLLIGAFFLTQHNRARDVLVQQQLRTISLSVQSCISTYFDTALHDLETASQQVERMALKDYQRYNLLKIVQNNHPAFTALAYYDVNGTVQASTSTDSSKVSPDIFSQTPALFERPYYSGTAHLSVIPLKDGTLALGIGQPVYFLDNSYVVGVIAALIPFDVFQKLLDRTILPSLINVLILNDHGKILAQTMPQMASQTAFSPKQQWNGTISINSIPYSSVAVPLDFLELHLKIVANVDSRRPWPPGSHFIIPLAFIVILLFFLTLLVGLTTHRKIILPIQTLANNSMAMLKGQSVDIPASADAELHKLGNAMMVMNQQLKDSNTSLAQEIEQRRLQEKQAILAKIEAEKANQAKSIFLANMSHEIRTPLHGMIGMLELLGKDYLNSEQQQLLSMTSLSGQRLQNVVNSILDLSQIESGKFELHNSDFSLSDLVSEVVDFMQLQTDAKSISIVAEVASDIPDQLNTDSGRIRQILINLINNSIKFSNYGTIRLTISLAERLDPQKLILLFTVKDEGNGISEEAQKTIFEAYDRGDNKKIIPVEGTGLGLAISAEFVQHMGGRLWLSNSNSSGSTFCFTIVCKVVAKKEPDAKTVLATQLEHSLGGIRIFLAEDEFINQRIISAYLEEQGCSVTVCADGQELLDTMQINQADIILMDIRMPILNGIETTKIIREIEKKEGRPPIPIVALTAQATTDFEEKCRRAGMNDYLTKPIPFKRLITIIRELTRNKS